ncbi:phage tail protein [uncultured Microbulbifer sp.]|uniref:phage tail protein n=1 Tax=uncultured Microbulbifer sp. TaxID=348147 RepID=UPI00263181FA|nr:phage tail protein [uncultured Microbulbifer sp.]
MTLSGLIAPDLTGDPASLDSLREMAEQGQPWSLVDGNGNVHGAWVIESLQETRSLFFADGTARKIEFRLQLKQVDGQGA